MKFTAKDKPASAPCPTRQRVFLPAQSIAGADLSQPLAQTPVAEYEANQFSGRLDLARADNGFAFVSQIERVRRQIFQQFFKFGIFWFITVIGK